MAKVSVIIPSYNAEGFIEAAVESVLAQSFRDFELIVIDNGSTDGTLQRLDKYRGKHVLLAEERRGPSACRNRGLAAVTGSLIAFLDADDLWLPDKLEKQVRVADQRPEYGIITTDVLAFDDHGIVRPSLRAVYPIQSGFVLEQLLFHNWITTSAAMVRRECFDVAGGFDEDVFWGEDWLLWMQIAERYPVYFLDEVLTKRRVHAGSLGHANQEAQFENLFRNLEKLEQRIPSLARSPHLVREAAYRICVNRGSEDLRSLNLPRAREKFRRGLQYKPWGLSACVRLIAAHTPVPFLRWVRTLVSKSRQVTLRRNRTRAEGSFRE